ncbi:MAG: damage-inducible protein CinA [Hyphomicrobium sp.]|nr:MAG: damage-inducible protein CinA [Hyphomicrobium sp.]
MFPEDLAESAERLLADLRRKRLTLATAESCTGGLLSGLLTEIAGSSMVVERGFVTYSNAAKIDLLGVAQSLLDLHGAVSAETAEAMARGALGKSPAGVAVSVTGIAGPGGGSAEKPVGLVYISAAVRGGAMGTAECRFGDIGRSHVRIATLRAACALIGKTIA